MGIRVRLGYKSAVVRVAFGKRKNHPSRSEILLTVFIHFLGVVHLIRNTTRTFWSVWGMLLYVTNYPLRNHLWLFHRFDNAMSHQSRIVIDYLTKHQEISSNNHRIRQIYFFRKKDLQAYNRNAIRVLTSIRKVRWWVNEVLTYIVYLQIP